MNTKNEILLRRRFCTQESPSLIEDNILTFTAEQANSTIRILQIGSPKAISLQCSMDGGNTWNNYILGNTITLTNIGNSVKFKGTNSTFSRGSSKYYQFEMTGKISASGDVTSLLNGVGGDVDLTGKIYCFYKLFYNCISLTKAPKLPSLILESYCYGYMFYGCTNLNYIKAMFTTTPSNSYTENWVSGVAVTGTFVKNSAALWNVTGVDGVPVRWTIETASE